MKLLSTLLEITVYSAALFAAILVFRALLKRHASPVLMYTIWFLLIARLLVPITFDAGFHLFTKPVGAPATDVSALLDGLNNDVTLNNSNNPALTQPDTSQSTAHDKMGAKNADGTTASTAASQPAPAAQTPVSWETVLIAVWLAVSGGLLMLAVMSSKRLKRRIQYGSESVPEHWRQIALEIASELHIRNQLRLAVVSGFPTPALSAGLRPVVVLPKELEDEEAVRFALRHELTHLQRGDHIVCLLWLVLRAVYWFNPVVWVAFKLMRLDMETACDSMVTKPMSAGGKTRYAQAVLAMHTKPQLRLALGMALGSTGKTVERRIRGIFMRSRTGHAARLTALLMAVIMVAACFTTACQPTPDKPVVVGKDQSTMLEKAVETPDKALAETEAIVPIKEQVNAPQTYSANVTVGDGKLKIVAADAPITLPDTDSMPIYRVKAADFTQEQVSGLFSALFNGQTVYEVVNGPQTKDEILESIVRLKKLKGSDEYSSEGDQAQLDEQIAHLEKQYESAPEKSETVITESDGMLKQMELTDPDGNHMAYYDGLNATTDYKNYEKAATFWVQNNNDMKEGVWHVNEGGGFGGMPLRRNAHVVYTNMALGYNYGQNAPIPVNENTVIDDANVLEKLKMSPAQAKAFCEDLLNKAGAGDMDLCSMYLEDDANLGNYDGIVSPAKHYAYHIYFCRTVNGIPCSTLRGSSTAGGDLGKTENDIAKEGTSADLSGLKYFGRWNYETLEMLVNDEGVVSLTWMSPLNVTDTVVEKSALIPFSRAAEVFEQRMRDTYEPEVKENHIEDKTFNVTCVALELQRVAEQNSIEDGLLVPVWNFYGTTVTRFMESETDSIVESKDGFGFKELLLVVNAVDGSVIDTHRGY